MGNTPHILSEDFFLELINRYFFLPADHVLVGRGDDCAVLQCPEQMVISTDMFVENRHFRRCFASAADIGHKALAVNISDIAAMGCIPCGFSLALMVPDAAPEDDIITFWEEFFQGMAALATCHNLPLTGGDISAGPVLTVSITIWGKPQPCNAGRQNILLRRQCTPQDKLILLGEPGLSRTGLMALETWGKQDATERFPAACQAHLRPEPLVAQGCALPTIQGVRACMDVSDGLARDSVRLTGNMLGAALELDAKDLHPEVLRYCTLTNQDPVAFAILGGEEYGLLVAVSPSGCGEVLQCGTGLLLGTVTTAPGLLVNSKPFTAQGFDHFEQK